MQSILVSHGASHRLSCRGLHHRANLSVLRVHNCIALPGFDPGQTSWRHEETIHPQLWMCATRAALTSPARTWYESQSPLHSLQFLLPLHARVVSLAQLTSVVALRSHCLFHSSDVGFVRLHRVSMGFGFCH